jgi:uncharacterized protein YuzE
MKITYDPRYNIAYIKLRDKVTREVDTIRLSDELNIDISSDGEVCGIELLNATKQLRIGKQSAFTFEDAAAGKRIRLPIPA